MKVDRCLLGAAAHIARAGANHRRTGTTLDITRVPIRQRNAFQTSCRPSSLRAGLVPAF
ncbi:hypothetical protein C7S14_1570 [Burkholderia cepacia]|nr:hypothetical protein C7S14_1570 [Burkholderia cepacia]